MRLIDADSLMKKFDPNDVKLLDTIAVRYRIATEETVQPAQKTGHWIPCKVSSGRDSWQCSVCGRRARGKIENLPYCHCGTKMKEGEEHENS